MTRDLEVCVHGGVDGVRCRPCEELPEVTGGDFVVTITYSVQLRVPDVAVVAAALELDPTDALVEIADVLGVAGLHLDELDALPLDSFSIVRSDRADTDVVPVDERPVVGVTA